MLKSAYSDTMLDIRKKINQNNIVFIARDIEKALGKNPKGSYYIITNNTQYASEQSGNTFLIDEDDILDTRNLLKHEKTKKVISNLQEPKLVVFKNTKQIQRICDQEDWELLNPSAEIINEVEQKISQVEWLESLTELMPDFEVKTCKEIEFSGTPFILQFNRAHTGSGTHLINDKDQLQRIKEKYPDRPAKISEYLEGDMFTLNCVVGSRNTLSSSISYQITGVEPFTDNRFATVGNDWSIAEQTLTQEQKEKIKKIGAEIGDKLRQDRFRGLFGIDVIKTKEGKIKLIEINARQPASTTFESQLQKKEGLNDKITTFEAHLAAMLELELNREIKNINNGSQIIYRNKTKNKIDPDKMKDELEECGYKVIKYNNKKPGSELLRIMSTSNIVEEIKDNKITTDIYEKITK
ncbi:MAG: ATP-grasp domain-containing protein [Candidatus Paceibacteria bacterium]